MKKYREFWINEHENSVHYAGNPFYGGKTGREERPHLHVIEYSAYKDAIKERDETRAELKLRMANNMRLTKERDDALKLLDEACEALEFYGSTENWTHEGRMSRYIFNQSDSDKKTYWTDDDKLDIAGAKARKTLQKIKEQRSE